MGQDKNKYKKPMASSEGSALVAMTASAVGKQVFLRAATVTTTVMTSMTSEDTTDKKRPVAVKKVRLSPVKKTAACVGSIPVNKQPFPKSSPMGRSYIQTP